MAFSVFNDIQAAVLPLIKAALDKSETLATMMAPFLSIGVTLYIIAHGYEVMRGGGGSSPILDLVSKIYRPVICFHLALAGGMYSSTVVGILVDIRQSLTGVFGGSGNSYVALDSAVQNAASHVIECSVVAFQNITFLPFNLNGILIIACLLAMGIGFVAYGVFACINFLVIDASLYVLFGFGPLFVAAFAFQATARFFDTWLSAVLKYSITAVVMAVIIGISNSLIQGAAASLNTNGDVSALFVNTATVIGGVLVIILLVSRVSTLAADMVGGIGINFSGGAAVAKAVGGMGAGAANAAGYVGGAAATGAGRFGSMAAGQVMGSPLGVGVLQQTEKMRAAVSSAGRAVASGGRNFGNAVAGRAIDQNGMASSGHGISNAFSIGRQATASTRGLGSVTSGRNPAQK